MADRPAALPAAPAGSERNGGSDGAAEAGTRAKDFDDLVMRVMALVPKAPPTDGPSTWVARSIRRFDMRSAFGNDE